MIRNRRPEPVGDNCTNHRWKWFKNFLGALDEVNGTYIKVREGSASDSRVLRDVITRPNGLRVPTGKAIS
ncbi:hypothetical protein L3X38_033750 [Prunus dulcis]|uniref:Uncharacterized protein n=1 Tax=Prunus dulcis TaxID=3755 RepID=A0AAD4VIY8_PRUDU|nr:hypothetical protein L3X38_033750 [Prunus dulcis]